MSGYYKGGGYRWKKAPKCWACGIRDAVYITNSVALCENPQCHLAFAEQEYNRIEFVESEEGNNDQG